VYFTIWTDIPEVTGPPIPYDHLATEDTDPYLDGGKPPTKFWDKVAVWRWPSARSCLIWSERNKDMPDLRLINWRMMRSHRDIRVCMFRIFSSLATPDRAVEWFTAFGLNPNKQVVSTTYNKGYTGVTAGRQLTFKGRTLVPAAGIAGWIQGAISFGENFGAAWDENQNLVTTSHGYSTL
jgi:hypothetical protein